MRRFFNKKLSLQKKLQNIFTILIIIILIHSGKCTNVTVTSQSNVTGELANYYFQLTNHHNPTEMIIQFSQWSVNDPVPYNSDFQIKQNITLSILNCSTFATGTIRCLITSSIFTGSVYPSIINLVMTSIYNPSSTKPYLITFYPKTTTTQTIITYLTMTTPLNSGIILLNYNYSITAASTNGSFIVQFDNYIDNTTILNFTYDSNLINISMNSGSFYNVITNSNGLKQITGWTGINLGSFILSSIQIINPSFALSYTISGISYFVQNGKSYLIQTYTITVQLLSISFTTLSTPNNITLGTFNNSLSISQTCSISSINNGTNSSAYVILTYDSTLISVDSTSFCIFQTNTSCIIYMATSSITFDKIKSLIPSSNISKLNLTASLYSYFSAKNQFYPTCTSSMSVNLIQQSFTPTTTLTSCNFQVLGSNNLLINFAGQGIISGDYLYVKNLLGTFNSVPISWTYDNVTTSYKTLINSSFLAISTTSVGVNFSLSYNNPTYTTSNSITIGVYRNGIQYGSGSISICTINKPYVKSSVLSISNATTFAQNKYMIQMGLALSDYKINDYLVIRFMGSRQFLNGNATITTTDFQSYSQLYFQITNNKTTSISINSIPVSYIYVNSSSIKLFFNSSALISSIATSFSLSISISNLSNSISEGFTKIYLVTYNFNDQLKQSSISNAVWISSSSLLISSTSIITLLQQNNISINLNQPYRGLISSDSSVLSTTLSLTSPFSCANVNNVTSTATFNWLKSLSNFTSLLQSCTLDFFVDMSKSIIIKQYIQYSITSGNATTNYSVLATSSIFYVSSTCGNNCYLCSSSTPSNCTTCFNSTHSSLIYLYSGTCYSICPDGSYLESSSSSVICNSCFSTCSTCNSSGYLACSTCSSDFIFNNDGICESICGQNQYYVDSIGSCQKCHPNCKGCLNNTNCYLCKDGAILIGTVCVFASCTSPCQTCQGSLTTCTSCISSATKPYYLYQNNCYSACPDGTYSNDLVCVKISTINLYFPCVIITIVLVLVALGLKCFSPKIIRNPSLNQTAKTINQTPKYKINMLRCLAVSLSFTQILSILIILAQGSDINPSGVNQTIIVGLIIYLVCNIIFGIGFYKKVYKKQKRIIKDNMKQLKQKNQNKQQLKINQSQNSQSQNQKDQQQQMIRKYQETYNIRELVIVGISCFFSFRIYRILQANVFNQENSLIMKTNKLIQKSFNDSKNQLLFNSETALKQSSRQNIEVQQKKNVTKIRKTLPNIIKVQSKESNKENKPIKNQTVNLSTINQNSHNLQTINRLQQLQQAKLKYRTRFLHPFYSYLCLGSFLSSSILFLVGAVLQILYKRYQNMMFWGLDSLVIIILMFFINIWDIWRLLNLPIQSQTSELSSTQQQINNTQQNIKPRQEEDFQNLKNDFGATTKLSPKKYSPIKNKSNSKNIEDNNILRKLSSKKSPMRKQSLNSNKSKSPSEKTQKLKNNKFAKSQRSDGESLQDYQDQVPKLKIFDDIQGQKQVQKGQKLKKWNVTMHPRMRNSTHGLGRYKQTKNGYISKTSRNKGWKLQDIYLGFLQVEQKNQAQVSDSNNENDQIQTVQMNNNFANVHIVSKKASNSIVNIDVEEDVEPEIEIENNNDNNAKIQNEYWEQQQQVDEKKGQDLQNKQIYKREKNDSSKSK